MSETYTAIGFNSANEELCAIQCPSRSSAINACNRIQRDAFLYTGLQRIEVLSDDTDIVVYFKDLKEV